MADSESLNQEKIVAFLATRDGSIEDPTGRGLTAELADAIGYGKPAALNVLLGQMESEGVITRDVRGLRTYRIALTEAQPVAVPAGRRSLRGPITDPTPPPAAERAKETVDWRSLVDEPTTPIERVGAGNGSPGPRVGDQSWRDIEPNGTIEARRTTERPTERPAADPADAWRTDPAQAWRTTSPRSDVAESWRTTGRPGSDAAESWRTTERDRQAEPFSALASPPPVDDSGPPPAWERTATRSTSIRRHWYSIEVPHVSGAPSTTVLAIVGVTMAILVIATVISVLTSGGGNKGSVVADNANSTIDACTLVTSPEASVAFGSDAKDPHEVLRACVFDNGSHQLIVDAADNKAKERFDAARGASAQDVNGVGDAAYYENGRLGVLKGSRMLLMTLVPYSPNAPSPALITLAKAAVSRL